MDKKTSLTLVVGAALTLAPGALAQKWEFGGGAGGSFSPANSIANGSDSASVKTQTNIASSIWLSDNISNHWGGDVRLDYSRGDLALSSGSAQTTFGSEAYSAHYDFLWHVTNANAKVRPFVAAGAGIKYYRGIGTEVAFQPLSQFALLTKTTQLKPMLSVGGGVKFQISKHLGLRLEVHDYLTTFPDNLITLNNGSKVSGWMQQIVPMAGLSYLFGVE